MSPEQIDRFFRTLAKEVQTSTTVILTGAAAGSLLGHVRASADVDFAILTGSDDAARWQQVEAAIARVERLTKIQAQYAEDIDRWSSISLLDYRRHARRYRRFGTLDLRILDPPYWAIGKLSRYLPQDREGQRTGAARAGGDGRQSRGGRSRASAGGPGTLCRRGARGARGGEGTEAGVA